MNTVTEMGAAFRERSQSTTVLSPQAGPGILVFSRSLQLQYVNRRAVEMIQNRALVSVSADSDGLSAHVRELRDEIQERLDGRLAGRISEPFEISRAVSERGQRRLLRGFGRPDLTAGESSRIIIVIQDINPDEDSEQGYADHDASERQPVCFGSPSND
jgi:hypothetical protein